MYHFMKILLTIIILFTWKLPYSQTNKFKGQIFINDSSLVSGGMIIFPLLNDTLKIDNSDTAIIDLNNSSNRMFYFLWSGWKSRIFRFNTNETSAGIKKISVPDTIFYRQFEEKHICPICLKSKPVIPIKYGMPTLKMLRQVKHEKFRLGGCLINDYNPKFYCKLDSFEF